MRYWKRISVVLLGLALTGSGGAATKRSEAALPASYGRWLNDQVNYLITKDEEAQFLALRTDTERDKFIDHFWAIRNPDPASTSNRAKDELYQRLAYADEHFGGLHFGDGVHTDRGMVYITLGPPKQKEVHPESPHLRPIEIWFYEDLSGGLPTHFYVMFYRKDRSDDYRLYSPYGDRPERLVDGTDAVNNDKVALHFIDNALGVEAKHVALSLIPGEPVDFNDPRPSLASDVLLNNIREYRNLPSTLRKLQMRRETLEGVSHRLLLGSEFSEMTVVASRDAANGESVHYLFSLRSPQDFGFGEKTGGGYFYSLQLHTELRDAGGKVVQHDEQTLGGDLSAKQIDALKQKSFSLEGRMPAAPGKYELRLEVTNKVTKQSFEQSRTVLVPRPDQGLTLSQVFFANTQTPLMDPGDKQPFSFNGVKLSPRGGENAMIPEGTPLRVVYQLWEPPAKAGKAAGTVEMHYLIGQLNATDKHEEDQTIDRASFDPAGNLLIGKDVATEGMAPGSYRLVIKATDPETHETSYQSLNFSIAARNDVPQRWTLLAAAPQTVATGVPGAAASVPTTASNAPAPAVPTAASK